MTLKAAATEDSRILPVLKDTILQAETLLSVTDAAGEVGRLNAFFAESENGTSVPKSLEISDTLAGVLSETLEYSRKTDGALNPALYPISFAWGFTTSEQHVPSADTIRSLLPLCSWQNISLSGNTLTMNTGMELDFGAIGKGYITRLCSDELKREGITSALLDLGGNIYTLGSKLDGSSWKIGIQLPFSETGESAGTLTSRDEAIVTSGSYQRYFEEDGRLYHHIIDGSTGYPADNELNSVTIVCADGFQADALSTAYFVMGLDKSEAAWRASEGVDVIWITKDNRIYYTEGLKGRFEVSSGLESEVISR